ncbi:TetR/AcrR family transcriptional regulator [Kitasatospora sp. NPDC049258]|uniref:TetR/AcrR family transcriptional regulator n=1 Tax=Kitasatospora sp. NPDC049258 TaxID=3155394 RepID=UPI00343C5368
MPTQPTQQRRERERADRQSLIVRVARELAEAEGWEAVTTRRLAERIEYSQPVLYSHFANRTAIVTAVALEGFGELTATLAVARRSSTDPATALAAVAHAYVDFATAGPALYEAMFTLATDLPFGPESAPAPLQAAFAELGNVLGPLAAGRDLVLFVEVGWAALHGLVTLARGGRLDLAQQARRVDLLVGQLLALPALPRP